MTIARSTLVICPSAADCPSSSPGDYVLRSVQSGAGQRPPAEILARGNRKASRWSLEGADLVYGSGEMQALVKFKSIRQTVAELETWEPSAGPDGASSPHLTAWEENPFSVGLGFRSSCITLPQGRSRSRDRGGLSHLPPLQQERFRQRRYLVHLAMHP
jgi:hypothetical protein